MITQEQIERLCLARKADNVPAILTRDYSPFGFDYKLLKGTIVILNVLCREEGDLLINGRLVDWHFPYDAAELLE